MNSQLQHRIDRLADNEVCAQELTQLLADIEHNNAWKQCALTLIEAAELKNTLRQMVQTSTQTTPPAPGGRSRLMSTLLAACLLGAAFVAGRGLKPRAEPQFVQTDTPTTAEPSLPPAPIEQQTPAENQTTVATNNSSAAKSPRQPKAGPEVVGFAQVLRQTGVSPRYPVIAGEFSDRELMELTTIPEHIRRRARSNGIEMERLPRVLTVQLADGQRLAVPMDALGLRQTRAEVL
ncbi:MAG: hypothetical protein NXI04_04670 [Planctomycetaceae bacterium]|nr:hypothetical protein [Planctomycetaceae bacterium]